MSNRCENVVLLKTMILYRHTSDNSKNVTKINCVLSNCTQCINTRKEKKKKKREVNSKTKWRNHDEKMADVRVMDWKMSYYWIDTIMI